MSRSEPVSSSALRIQLEQALPVLGLSLTAHQTDALMNYLDLIQKWNKVYNLTAVRDPADMLTHHLLDSLAVIVPLRARLEATQNAMTHFAAVTSGAVHAPVATRLLDVGSGAGLPGIVVAICCPGIQVDCVDTVAKKAAFIQQAAVTLKLTNLRGIHARVENLAGPYDVISSRAFASLVDFTTWSQAALAEQGIWMAMKGKHPDDELAALPQSVEVFHVEQLSVPGLDAERCIVWMRARRV